MSRLGKQLLLGLLTLLLTLPAGCGGSSLSPSTVRAANQGVQGAPGSDPARPSASAGSASAGRGAKHATSGAGHTAGSAAGSTTSTSRSGGGSGPSVGTGVHAATGATSKVSCAGFHDQTGITAKTITIANASDISGPIPGIFASAQEGVKAYAAYFNATSSLCGRKLSVEALDTRTDAGADQQAYSKACQSAFAAVGSMSAYDYGGASTAQSCGLPDLRTLAVSDQRNACTTCFGAQATDLHAFENAVPDFFLKHDHAATQHAAMLYVNAPASVENAKTQIGGEQAQGFHFAYTSSFDVSEFNYTPYVQRMQDKGVRWLQFVGSTSEAVNLARSMQQAHFKPAVFLLDPTSYNAEFVKDGGSAVDGAYIFIDFVPFSEVGHNKEMQLYEQWLQQVHPGAHPTYFGLFAWSSARLFVEQAAALGGHLDRASLVSRLRHVSGWTDNGLHAPQPVGAKHNSNCWRFIRLEHSQWVPVGNGYTCAGQTDVH